MKTSRPTQMSANRIMNFPIALSGRLLRAARPESRKTHPVAICTGSHSGTLNERP